MKIRGTTVGTPIKPEKVLVKSENLTEEEKAIARDNIGAAAKAASVMTVKRSNGVMTHSFYEVKSHISSGGTAQYIDTDGVTAYGPVYTLLNFSSSKITFYRTVVIPGGRKVEHTFVEYNDDGRLNKKTYTMDIESSLGTIDTALDSILAIQNELIGGDSV